MVQQYTTQTLLPHIAKLIDDLEYENFHVPTLMHQYRVVRKVENAAYAVGHVFAEADYVDAKPEYQYAKQDWTLRDIKNADEVRRLYAINDAFSDALSGKPISSAKLRCALTAEQLYECRRDVLEMSEQSEIMYGDGMPEQLRSYNIKLNKADMAWGRFESAPTKLKHGRKRKVNTLGSMEDRVVSLYEAALEDLEETFTSAQRGDWGNEMIDRLHRWMDRPIDFDAGIDRKIDVGVHSMPRVRGSTSLYAEDSGLPKLSKRLKRNYCALNALVEAAANIAFEFPAVVVDADAERLQSAALQNKLRQLMKVRD